jgi:hypothetical protein
MPLAATAALLLLALPAGAGRGAPAGLARPGAAGKLRGACRWWRCSGGWAAGRRDVATCWGCTDWPPGMPRCTRGGALPGPAGLAPLVRGRRDAAADARRAQDAHGRPHDSRCDPPREPSDAGPHSSCVDRPRWPGGRPPASIQPGPAPVGSRSACSSIALPAAARRSRIAPGDLLGPVERAGRLPVRRLRVLCESAPAPVARRLRGGTCSGSGTARHGRSGSSASISGCVPGPPPA